MMLSTPTAVLVSGIIKGVSCGSRVRSNLRVERVVCLFGKRVREKSLRVESLI